MAWQFAIAVLVIVSCLCHQGKCDLKQCLNASEAPNKLSCAFYYGFCRWSNIADGDFDWTRYYSQFSGRHYIAAEGGSADSRAVLESSLVCSTGDNVLQLQFGYYIRSDDSRCQLTASVQTELGAADMVTLTNHKESGLAGVGLFRIFCPNVSFKIIFEARKMPVGWSGVLTCKGVYIDYILVDLVHTTRASFTMCPTNTTHPPSVPTISTPVTAGRVGSTSASTAGALKPRTSDDGGPSSGAVAGIIVAVLVIVAAVVVVVGVSIWRRKGHPDTSTTSPEYVNSRRRERNVSLAVANSAYEPDLPFSTAPTSAKSLDQPRASAYYSTATPTDDAPAKPRIDEDGYEVVTTPNPDTTGNTHQGQMIGSPTTSTGGKAHDLKDHKGKATNHKPDEYNALSFKPAQKTAPSSETVHYDHLHGTEEGPDSYNKLSFGAKASADSSVGGIDYDHLQD